MHFHRITQRCRILICIVEVPQGMEDIATRSNPRCVQCKTGSKEAVEGSQRVAAGTFLVIPEETRSLALQEKKVAV